LEHLAYRWILGAGEDLKVTFNCSFLQFGTSKIEIKHKRIMVECFHFEGAANTVINNPLQRVI
jgi:hypothetical protein